MVNQRPFSSPWSTGKCVVFFSAPWCGHCKSFANVWNTFKQQMKSTHPQVRVITMNSDTFNTRHVKPEIFGFPTIRAYSNGQMVEEFEDMRTLSKLQQFATSTLLSDQAQQTRARSLKAGKRLRRTHSRHARVRRGQRGGNASGISKCGNSIGKAYDIQSGIPPTQQYSSPFTKVPPPPYNGGLYTGPPFSGPWGSIPVTPTAASYINQNLRSANPPPGATTQYPTAATDRPGNNYSGMPGVHHFEKQGYGPYHVLGTAGGGKRGRSQRRCATHRRRRTRRGRGGLNLTSGNLDNGPSFHPVWSGEARAGGRRSNRRQLRRNRASKRSRRSRKLGGLRLRSSNMDDGPPFHPQWE